jgi:hypothetical protein
MEYKTSKQENIGLAGAICIGVSVLLAGYILMKSAPYLEKIHNKLFHSTGIEQKVDINSNTMSNSGHNHQ